MNTVKVFALMVAMTTLLISIGYITMGPGGMLGALILAGGLNFYAYWQSDKLILKQYDAKKIDENTSPTLHRIVNRLAQKANIPKPNVYIIPDSTPNAFATGRNPENAAVAATEGLVNRLSDDELEGVLAHELSHVKNRDTLISAIAATLAGAIMFIASIARFGALFGLGGRGRNNMLILLVMAIVAPIAALLIRSTISRTREYKADHDGAKMSGKPVALANALQKLEQQNKGGQQETKSSENTAHLFIVNPLSADGITSLFSTHPSTEKRVERLHSIARDRDV